METLKFAVINLLSDRNAPFLTTLFPELQPLDAQMPLSFVRTRHVVPSISFDGLLVLLHKDAFAHQRLGRLIDVAFCTTLCALFVIDETSNLEEIPKIVQRLRSGHSEGLSHLSQSGRHITGSASDSSGDFELNNNASGSNSSNADMFSDSEDNFTILHHLGQTAKETTLFAEFLQQNICGHSLWCHSFGFILKIPSLWPKILHLVHKSFVGLVWSPLLDQPCNYTYHVSNIIHSLYMLNYPSIVKHSHFSDVDFAYSLLAGYRHKCILLPELFVIRQRLARHHALVALEQRNRAETLESQGNHFEHTTSGSKNHEGTGQKVHNRLRCTKPVNPFLLEEELAMFPQIVAGDYKFYNPTLESDLSAISESVLVLLRSIYVDYNKHSMASGLWLAYSSMDHYLTFINRSLLPQCARATYSSSRYTFDVDDTLKSLSEYKSQYIPQHDSMSSFPFEKRSSLSSSSLVLFDNEYDMFVRRQPIRLQAITHTQQCFLNVALSIGNINADILLREGNTMFEGVLLSIMLQDEHECHVPRDIEQRGSASTEMKPAPLAGASAFSGRSVAASAASMGRTESASMATLVSNLTSKRAYEPTNSLSPPMHNAAPPFLWATHGSNDFHQMRYPATPVVSPHVYDACGVTPGTSIIIVICDQTIFFIEHYDTSGKCIRPSKMRLYGWASLLLARVSHDTKTLSLSTCVLARNSGWRNTMGFEFLSEKSSFYTLASIVIGFTSAIEFCFFTRKYGRKLAQSMAVFEHSRRDTLSWSLRFAFQTPLQVDACIAEGPINPRTHTARGSVDSFVCSPNTYPACTSTHTVDTLEDAPFRVTVQGHAQSLSGDIDSPSHTPLPLNIIKDVCVTPQTVDFPSALRCAQQNEYLYMIVHELYRNFFLYSFFSGQREWADLYLSVSRMFLHNNSRLYPRLHEGVKQGRALSFKHSMRMVYHNRSVFPLLLNVHTCVYFLSLLHMLQMTHLAEHQFGPKRETLSIYVSRSKDVSAISDGAPAPGDDPASNQRDSNQQVHHARPNSEDSMWSHLALPLKPPLANNMFGPISAAMLETLLTAYNFKFRPGITSLPLQKRVMLHITDEFAVSLTTSSLRFSLINTFGSNAGYLLYSLGNSKITPLLILSIQTDASMLLGHKIRYRGLTDAEYEQVVKTTQKLLSMLFGLPARCGFLGEKLARSIFFAQTPVLNISASTDQAFLSFQLLCSTIPRYACTPAIRAIRIHDISLSHDFLSFFFRQLGSYQNLETLIFENCTAQYEHIYMILSGIRSFLQRCELNRRCPNAHRHSTTKSAFLHTIALHNTAIITPERMSTDPMARRIVTLISHVASLLYIAYARSKLRAYAQRNLACAMDSDDNRFPTLNIAGLFRSYGQDILTKLSDVFDAYSMMCISRFPKDAGSIMERDHHRISFETESTASNTLCTQNVMQNKRYPCMLSDVIDLARHERGFCAERNPSRLVGQIKAIECTVHLGLYETMAQTVLLCMLLYMQKDESFVLEEDFGAQEPDGSTIYVAHDDDFLRSQSTEQMVQLIRRIVVI